MNHDDHVRSLIWSRLARNGLSSGLASEQAASQAEQIMRKRGLFGGLSYARLRTSPDAAISDIVATWLRLWKHHYRITNFDADGSNSPPRDNERAMFSAQIIRKIEAIRGDLLPGLSSYPEDLFGYIAYRVRFEVRYLHHISPDDAGFDEQTIRELAQLSYQYHRRHMN
jgi:hypothetical protein